MTRKRYMILRDITGAEAHWLKETIPAGTFMYEHYGPTYGVIGPNGKALCFHKDAGGFVEIPRDAISAPIPEMPTDSNSMQTVPGRTQ